MRKNASIALLGLLLLAAAPVVALEEGDKAPSFSARGLLGGDNVTLAAHRGKVVYLDFWASWCGPCAKALPELDKLRSEFPEGSFQVLAINVDRDQDKAKKFLSQHPVGYPSAADPEGQLPKTFEIETMPTSFLIDANGVIRYVHRGFRAGDIDEIRERIRQLLEEN